MTSKKVYYVDYDGIIRGFITGQSQSHILRGDTVMVVDSENTVIGEYTAWEDLEELLQVLKS